MSTEIGIIIVLVALVFLLFLLWQRATNRLSEIAFRKNSLSVRYGKMTEQFMPFLKDYPFLPENFRFLGTPIDGIQFEDNKIIFLEFKTAGSQLSARQRQIAEQVFQKKVEFREVKID